MNKLKCESNWFPGEHLNPEKSREHLRIKKREKYETWSFKIWNLREGFKFPTISISKFLHIQIEDCITGDVHDFSPR